MKRQKERRQWPREILPTPEVGIVYPRYSEEEIGSPSKDKPDTLLVHLINMSDGGLLLESCLGFQVGSLLDMQIRIPHRKVWMPVKGKVIWIDEDPTKPNYYLLGVKFQPQTLHEQVPMHTMVVQQVINELAELRQRIGELEVAETEYKRAEEELKAAQEYTRNLIDSSLDMIISVDQDRRIVEFNLAAQKAFGYTKAEVLGKHVDILYADSAEGLKVHKTLRATSWFIGEVLNRRKNGETFPSFLSASAMQDANGEFLGIMGISRDITERKRTEEKLKQAMAELERSNRELEQYAYAVSHDLREPLNTLASFLMLLERRYKGRLDSKADEFIARAVDGATRMDTVINDLLAYCRVGMGGKPLEPIDLPAILKQALANLDKPIKKSCAVVTHDPLPTVMADATQMIQLFQNLIGNAIKFRSNLPPEIHIGVECKDGEWLFAVKDNGIGIDQQYAESIFGVFQRPHSREKYPGTGIGLAICKKIVECHGGRIWVESQPGKGSIFYFTIQSELGEIAAYLRRHTRGAQDER